MKNLENSLTRARYFTKVGKNKLKRFNDNKSYEHVVEPHVKDFVAVDHPLKGKWHTDFFKNNNPIVLELGCGKGEYTIGLAKRNSDINYIGVDIKGARLWRGATTAFENGMKNVGFLRTRIELINSFFAANEVSEIWITFPDPQMKKKRTKKRLTSTTFLTYYQKFLKHNGVVNLKTDSTFLYNYTNKVAGFNSLEILRNTDDLYSEQWINEILSIQTHYEKLHIDDGDNINYISFVLPAHQLLKEPPNDDEEE